MTTCPACGHANPEGAKFCMECASPLGALVRAVAEVRKTVTVVFCDVTGSTALGERLDPEALRRVMGRYFDGMAAVIERHEGTVEKFIGDAVMAVFGIPRLHEDDALRAVRAASEMHTALHALNADLERDHGVGLAARIGVNTGEVVAGDPGAGQQLVTGDTVNVAARLEQAAAPGEVLLGESTVRLVRDAVEVEPVDPLALKGKADRVPAFRLLRVLEDTAGHERHLDSPMVGRAKELAMLERALERAVSERTSHLFTLLGPAGVGKSRLVQEFLGRPTSSATVLRGRCLSYGEGITFFPLAEVVQEASGIGPSDGVAAARSKLAALASGADDAERIVTQVAGLLALGEPVQAEEAFWGVRKLLEHLARDRPLVVLFDDIHWAEPTFLDLVEHLADCTRDTAILLLCVARPELLEIRPGWGGGKMNATSILLEPLDGEAASALIDNLLGPADLPPAARRQILEAAEGNPLFVEEMVSMLIDDGLLRFEGGSWRTVEDLAEVTVPPTIQLLLAARLDRLDAEERAVIERGAVEGTVFHAGAVSTLSSEVLRPKVLSRLLALARKELIRPDRAEFAGEDAYRFRHPLIRDAAYQALPKEQRAQLHERFAWWLEQVTGDRVAEYEEILGHHLEQAVRYRMELGPPDETTRELGRRAARLLLSCAGRAQAREDLNAARGFYERAVGLTEGVDRVIALVGQADVAGDLGDYPSSFRAATEASQAAEEIGERAWALRAQLIRSEARGQTDPTSTNAEAMANTEGILAEFESMRDEEGRDLALLALGRLWFYQGKAGKALEIAERLAGRAGAMGSQDRLATARGFSSAAYFGPLPLEEGVEAMARAREVIGDSARGEIFVVTIEGGLLGLAGRFDEARAAFERADDIAQDLGVPYSLGRQVVGEIQRLEGRTEEAAAHFRAGCDEFTALGETGFNSTISALLAATLCDLGLFEEAETFVQRSREMTSEDDFASQAAWRVAQARILSERGEHDEALALADEAVRINEATDYLVWQGDSHEVRGTVLRNAGRMDEARAAFEQALSRYEAKGVVPSIARIRERLTALS